MTNSIQNVDEYKSAVEDLRHEAEAHLRKSGWKHTSSTPGCYWMWEKEMDGRVFLVEFETAMRIQSHNEAEERYPDGPPSSRDPRRDED